VTDLPTTIMCPRCHQNPASDIYGPCTDCRTQLRDQADTRYLEWQEQRLARLRSTGTPTHSCTDCGWVTEIDDNDPWQRRCEACGTEMAA
jgi:hypothetical protein